MGRYDYNKGDVRSRNPENNSVRVRPSTSNSKHSKYSGDGGYFVKEETGIYSTTPVHEIWHGFHSFSLYDHFFKPLPNGTPNISVGQKEINNSNSRVVTQYNLFQLRLDKILCNGNITGVVGGREGNNVYDETGYGSSTGNQDENPPIMKIVRKTHYKYLWVLSVVICLSSCSRIFIEGNVINKWKSDPGGCKEIRNWEQMQSILNYANGLDRKNKLKLNSKLGLPDKITYHKGQKRSIYYLGCKCENGIPIVGTQEGELEFTQDSLRVYFSFETY